MTAAMNGSINFSIPDGWIPEFARHNENCFLIEPADGHFSLDEKDKHEALHLIDMLELDILPTYYQNQQKWLSIIKQAANDVSTAFESGRMAKEYYEKMYSA